MNGLLGQRKASRFAQAVDASVGSQPQSADPELAKLVALTQELRSLPSLPGPSEQFQAKLRQRLLAVGSVQTAASTAQKAKVSRFKKVATRLASVPVAIGVGVFTLLQVTAGVSVAASANALPGDALYGLKRATERAELILAPDDQAKADRLLTFSKRRINEVNALLERTSTSANSAQQPEAIGIDSAILNKALADMNKNTTQATALVTSLATTERNPNALKTLLTFASTQKIELAELTERLPNNHVVQSSATVALLDQVSARAKELTTALTCRDCQLPSKTDQLGPIPCSGTCPSSGAGANPANSSSSPTPAESSSASPTTSPSPTPAAGPTPIPLPPLPLPSQLPTDLGPPEGGLLQPASPSQSFRLELPRIFH